MDGSTLHLLDSGQSYVCNGITPTLSAGAHARYHRRIVQFVQNWETDPTAINAILFSICLIFPWGWCKVRIFSQTKRNFIPLMQIFGFWQKLSKWYTYFAGASVRWYHRSATRHPRICRNLCAHPLHLPVSSYVRLAYDEMRLATEDEGTVHARTRSQAGRAHGYQGQVNIQ